MKTICPGNFAQVAAAALTSDATRRKTMSAAARARVSKATKKRWAKFRAEKAKKAK